MKWMLWNDGVEMSNATLFANAGWFRKIKCKHGNAMCKWQRKLVRGTSWRARAWGQHVSFQKHPLKTWIRLLSADVNAVYAIDDFPGDALLWRIEWIGGVGYNTSVPSDPQISICLAQLPAGQTDPLSARSRSSQTKRTVRIGVGLLPYISIASV